LIQQCGYRHICKFQAQRGYSFATDNGVNYDEDGHFQQFTAKHGLTSERIDSTLRNKITHQLHEFKQAFSQHKLVRAAISPAPIPHLKPSAVVALRGGLDWPAIWLFSFESF